MSFPHSVLAQHPCWAWYCSCFQSLPSSESRQRSNALRGSYLALIWVLILVNFVQRRVYVYRPGVPVEQLDNPETVSGDPELPGFVLKLGEIW